MLATKVKRASFPQEWSHTFHYMVQNLVVNAESAYTAYDGEQEEDAVGNELELVLLVLKVMLLLHLSEHID